MDANYSTAAQPHRHAIPDRSDRRRVARDRAALAEALRHGPAARLACPASASVRQIWSKEFLEAGKRRLGPAFIVVKAADEFKNKTTPPALADRLHLSEGNRLGLVLSQHDLGRLLAVHHRMEAVYDDES